MMNPDISHLSIHEICKCMRLPQEISQSYIEMGVRNVYEWQYDCIVQTGVAAGNSIVYCAPTSGGKTLVSELIINRTATHLRKRAIFVLPFVSLVLEKENYFKRLLRRYFRSCNKFNRFKIKSYHSDINGYRIKNDELIIICTIEKANVIVNSLIGRGLGHTIGCVVIDEMHTLGDSFNGYLLEILVR